uniref:Ubiquitin-activating enzyme SCCH domain-containing protein n=1 Tax=Parascaris equorum TaxID=6256 RepID=A0A914S1P4_PAREQ
MEFITAASNLRAENYDIQPADRMKVKFVCWDNAQYAVCRF